MRSPIASTLTPACRGIVRPLLRLALSIALVVATAGAGAGSPGDAKVGKALHDKDCVGCHARSFGGDAAAIYLRSDRKVRTPAQLATQVAYCNTQLGTGYFPEEEEHVAVYLHIQYYKFTR